MAFIYDHGEFKPWDYYSFTIDKRTHVSPIPSTQYEFSTSTLLIYENEVVMALYSYYGTREYVTITCIVNPGVITQLVITVPVFMVL